jgi:hypothetical protein
MRGPPDAEIERVGQTGCIADAGPRVIAVEASYRTIEAALKVGSRGFGHSLAVG